MSTSLANHAMVGYPTNIHLSSPSRGSKFVRLKRRNLLWRLILGHTGCPISSPGPGGNHNHRSPGGVFRPLSNFVNKGATETKTVSNERSLRDDSKAHKIFDIRSIFEVRGQGQMKNRHMCSDFKSRVLKDGRRQKTAKLGVKRKKRI